jgi:hypothetical protein
MLLGVRKKAIFYSKQLLEITALMAHTAIIIFVSHPKSMASNVNKIVNVYRALVLTTVYVLLVQTHFIKFNHGFGVY